MVKQITFATILLFTFQVSYGQSGLFGYNQLNEEQKHLVSSFHLPNQEVYRTVIKRNRWIINAEDNNWIYFSARPIDMHQSYMDGQLPDYYIEYAPPYLLNDSMRLHHHVDPVHNGIGLSSPYKGKDVIIGFVDTGIDIGHPDFKDSNGKTRILRIWDQSVSSGSTISPYGYGIIWDSTQINAGVCTSVDNSAHGTTVAGASAGNGNSAGYNHGVAPEADIIMIKSNLSAPGWTQTVADACDYVFKVADSLGKPAVINLSVGTYLGSHDGTDPASIRINNLLDAKNGRIVVSACGNSGAWGSYHCQGVISPIDTSFVWFENNPSSSFGSNKIYFDLYSTFNDADYNYSFKAVNPANNYETRAELIFRPAKISIGTPVLDTLRNSFGDRIATVEIYTYHEGSNFRMQVLFRNVDSTNYLYGFYTVGSGKYDLWSGTNLGYNTIYKNIPSSASFPSIVHYNLPDTLQSIVSSWNCSPKVVSVGNTRNRMGYVTRDGSTYAGAPNPVGNLSPNSSKGPNRLNHIKPDITASGDVILAPGPLWYLSNPVNFSVVDSGGWFMRNGGTSMSSPVVAGIAALYLERCEQGNYHSFLELIKNYSSTNPYTGILPNNAYGYGVINAYNILQNQEFTATLQGNEDLCTEPNEISIQSSETIATTFWSDGSTDLINLTNTPGDLYATAYNENGCGVSTDTITLTQLVVETIVPITISEDFLTFSTTSSNGDYQWTFNGVDIVGETSDTLILSSIQEGIYDCYTTSSDGCIIYAGSVDIYLSLSNGKQSTLITYPNPVNNKVNILSKSPIISVRIVDLTGHEIPVTIQNNMIDVEHLSAGYYQLIIDNKEGTFHKKIVKQK